MKIIDQTLHLIGNSSQRVGGVLTESMKHAESFLVLVYAGVIANIRGQRNGSHHSDCPCNNADWRGCFLISAETNRCISCECEELEKEY